MRLRVFGCGLTLAATVLAFPDLVGAQVSIGAGAGVTFATVRGDDVDEDDTETKTGFYLGGSVSIPVGEIVGIGTGAYYVQKGTGVSEAEGGGSVDLAYLEIPALLQVQVTGPDRPVGVGLFLGPTFGFNLSCEDADGEDCGDNTKSVDLGALFGAGASFAAGETAIVSVNAGLDLGLTSIDEREAFDDVKNQAYFLGVGVSWPMGG